jgi:flagellar biosynthesis protein FlhB
MAEQSFEERTEQATPKRRSELRKQGRVVKSAEFTSASVLLGGTLIIYLLGSVVVGQLSSVMKEYLSFSFGTELSQTDVVSLASGVVYRFLSIIAPYLIIIMVIGIIANVAQFGFVFTFKPLMNGMGALNPLKGIKKLGFSQHAMIELAKSILKVTLVGLIGYMAVKSLIAESVQLVDSSPQEIFSFMGSSAFAIGIKIAAAFMVLAVVDYYVQRKKFQRDTRMSKQEIKEEHKQDEGNPATKGRIRREMVKRHKMRMMQSVPKADVIVTNPTHYAIAIQYDAKVMAAPKVLAKGKDLVAQKIKEIAAEHNIPMVEDKPLAQLLYKTVDVDEFIPPDLFKAVAQILAYIYQMKKKKRGYGTA